MPRPADVTAAVIDQDGQPQIWKAHFWQHYVERWSEFDNPEDAFAFLDSGEDDGALSAVGVIDPDGVERTYRELRDGAP